MELILTQDIPKLGDAGDVVRVKNGYGRNYLLPRGMAMLATQGRVKDLEHKKRVIEEKQRKEVGSLEEVARRLAGIELEFQVQAGEAGKLFGSVTTAEIVDQVREKGIEIDRRKIQLSEPIKQLGEYEVRVRLHREVSAEIKVKVIPIE